MSLQAQDSDLRQATADVLAAWRAELSLLVGGIFDADRSERIATPSENGLALSGAADGRSDVVLVLPSSDVLRPVVKLPLASDSVLRSVLDYELEKLSPVPPDQVYYDFQATSRDRATKSAELSLRIIRRDIVDRAASQCRIAGLAVGAIRFGDDPVPADRRHFPIERSAWLRGVWRRWSVAILGCAALAMLLAVLLAAYLRGAATLDALSDELLDTGARASRAEQLQHRIEHASKQLAFLSEQKRTPPFAAILADIARILPDGSWLTGLDIQGGKIRIEGYSRSASDLIAVFDRSGRFANAQFAAPVTESATPGVERFDLSFEVARP
ncbi:MAG TPA: PilN domain-containing protein [Rhizomicrobium sp.]|nr:PilN domain-containing protein [Rhizomicrobium sp.]